MRIQFIMLLGIAAILLASCSSKPTIEELKIFAATETYPEDNNLDTISNKTALIVVAHDDDDCAMSGTIAKLTAEGWMIKQLSFVTHPVNGTTGNNPAAIICDGNELILEDGYYRKGLDTIQYPYLPLQLEEMDKQFLREKITKALLQKINQYNPSVIFSMDDIKGGYGHPDHIFLSKLIVELFKEKAISAQFIYQSVYTDHMEKEIVDIWLGNRLKKWGYPNTSDITNEMYGIDGMPEPDVQINITSVAETKMKYLWAYPEDARKNIRKFVPYYQEFDANTYFSVFDREFFRVIQH